MTSNNQKGAALPTTIRHQVIVNFCRTVLRSDDDLLRRAMRQYQQALAAERRA